MNNQWLNSVYSDGSKHYVSNPTPKKGEKIKILIRMCKSSPVEKVILRCKMNGVEILNYMELEYEKNGFNYYSVEVTLYEDIFHYHFYIVTKDVIYYYNQLEITDYLPQETYDFKIITDYEQPSWIKESVFYQIFPDRFCNGNPDNDVQDNEYLFDGHPTIKMNWDDKPLEYADGFCLDFFGGDLEGVKKQIPYLKELGVNAIYINPIFYAATVHKYDCLDYFTVDPHFGGDEALADLMTELHANDMKLIIDVSINHTGTAHKWFNKEGLFFDKSIGAYNNKGSKERNYYFIDENNKYHAWFGVETLPTLNYTSEDLRRIIYKSEESLVKKWLKPPFNIDGWRFDVADTMARQDRIQLHHEVWPEIRKSIKEENPLAYILGEDWTDCTEFLEGDEWDSAMNYFGFGRPVREFVGELDLFNKRNDILNKINYKLTAKNLTNRVTKYLAKLPHVIQENQFNLFDSHDVTRLHNNPEISFDKYRAAVIMMFTFPGTPNIYYGDEVGIDGHINTVEGCRYPMPWNEEKQDKNYYRLYQTLAHLKRSEEALQSGGFKVLYDEGYIFSYARFTDDKILLGICSTDEEEREVNIPVNLLGVSSSSVVEEVFGESVDYSVGSSGMQINVGGNKSYLLNIKL